MKTISYKGRDYQLVSERADLPSEIKWNFNRITLQFTALETWGILILEVHYNFHKRLNKGEIEINEVMLTNTEFNAISEHYKNPGGVPGFEG